MNQKKVGIAMQLIMPSVGCLSSTWKDTWKKNNSHVEWKYYKLFQPMLLDFAIIFFTKLLIKFILNIGVKCRTMHSKKLERKKKQFKSGWVQLLRLYDLIMVGYTRRPDLTWISKLTQVILVWINSGSLGSPIHPGFWPPHR